MKYRACYLTKPGNKGCQFITVVENILILILGGILVGNYSTEYEQIHLECILALVVSFSYLLR